MDNVKDATINAAVYVGKKLAYSAIHPTSLAALGLAYTFGGPTYICGWALYSVLLASPYL